MPTYFTNDASTPNTVAYAYTTGYANNPITSNVLVNVLTPYDTIALRNTALSSYLTTSTASSTYATITNLNAKENTLTFSAPFTRTTNNISLNYDNSKLGINASGSLTVIAGTMNYNSNQFDTTSNTLNIKSIATTQITSGTPTYTGGISTNAGNNNIYITYSSNGTITFPVGTVCDVLVVGAGGKGLKGGGGAGEVIYSTNYLFNTGTYNISIGLDSFTASNRTTKIYQGAIDIVKAFGGGDGGFTDFYQSSSSNTYTFYNSSSLVINKTNTITYPRELTHFHKIKDC